MAKDTQIQITGNQKSIKELLSSEKFSIDYFQRGYRWEEKHIQTLIDDLTTSFLNNYGARQSHDRTEVRQYFPYYLGQIVLSEQPDNTKSIIDGQQRMTSITLLLIYLSHKMKEHGLDDHEISTVNELVYSARYGEKTFNIADPYRKDCMHKLFFSKNGADDSLEGKNETAINIIDRYNDIDTHFPDGADGIDRDALPYFKDWLMEKVITIEVVTNSTDSAYTIFETMNDRGLNLTPSEMLKGFVLSKITEDGDKRESAKNIWQREMQKLHAIDKNADNDFFQAWFRGKYAQNMRDSKKGSTNQDYESIAQFHSWFRLNHKEKMHLETSDDFFSFVENQIAFFVKWYIHIRSYEENDFLYFIKNHGIAYSLQDALLLSVINDGDDGATIEKKLSNVAKFIEMFAIRRALNQKRYGASGIKNTFFGHIKDVRGSDLASLNEVLKGKYNDPNPDVAFGNIGAFQLNTQNKKSAKHFLARVTNYIENLAGKTGQYRDYYEKQKGVKEHQIEHVLGKQEEESFDGENDFNVWRNKLGALGLLQQGTNQSFKDEKYAGKREHYLKVNYWLASLHDGFYSKNPNFTSKGEIKGLKFEPCSNFNRDAIEQRNALLIRLSEQIWGNEYGD